MNVYMPSVTPPLPGENFYGTPAMPIPESLWRDDEVRRSIEYALRLEREEMKLMAKELDDAWLRPILSLKLRGPFDAPGIVQAAGCLDENNLEVKDFAYMAYDALDAMFDGRWTDNWFIAAYMEEDDEDFRLGVYVID